MWTWIFSIVGVVVALVAFAVFYPWQSDPWGLQRWL